MVFFVENRLKYISVNFDKKRKSIEYSLKTAKLTYEVKNKKIPVRTVLKSKTLILETGEQIHSGNITLILITSLVYSNSSFFKFLCIPLRMMPDNEQKEKWKPKILIPCEVADTN